MISFTRRETLELIKAWVAISIAFTIMFTVGNFKSITFTAITFIVSLITAGLGFILHELGHKVVAERYGCRTEFIADNKMLLFAIFLSFFGFIFAAPGAVWITGHIDQKKNGKISLAGPMMNLILAIAFLPGMLIFQGLIGAICFYGFSINMWLGLFNMIPLGNFDGIKILNWNKPIYFSVVAILLAGVLFSMLG